MMRMRMRSLWTRRTRSSMTLHHPLWRHLLERQRTKAVKTSVGRDLQTDHHRQHDRTRPTTNGEEELSRSICFTGTARITKIVQSGTKALFLRLGSMDTVGFNKISGVEYLGPVHSIIMDAAKEGSPVRRSSKGPAWGRGSRSQESWC